MSRLRAVAAVSVAAAAVTVAFHYWRRRRACQRLFFASVQDAFARAGESEQCILHAETAKTIRNLRQGSFALIEADLTRCLPLENTETSIAALKAAGLPDAFALRRELVNMKKACLRLLHDVERVSDDLTRHDMFFFRDTRGGALRDVIGSSGMVAHEANYTLVCRSVQRAKGLIVATRDARDFTKFLCALPRHPDEADGCHQRLRAMPDSFESAMSLRRALDFLESAASVKPSAVASRHHTIAPGAIPRRPAASQAFTVGKARLSSGTGEDSLPPELIRSAADVAVSRATSLPWHIYRVVKLAVVARGGAKALSIRAGLERYRAALESIHKRTASVLEQLACSERATAAQLLRLQSAAPTTPQSAPSHAATSTIASAPAPASICSLDVPGHLPAELADEHLGLIRRRMLCSKHISHLGAVHEATAQFLKILNRLALRHACMHHATPPASPPHARGEREGEVRGREEGGEEGGEQGEQGERGEQGKQRLFVAGDAMGQAMFYPQDFRAIVAMLAGLARSARENESRMRDAIASEGWPSPPSTFRTRVLTSGALACWRCERKFSKHWLTRGVCWQCEAALRELGGCPHDERAKRAAGVDGGGGMGRSRGRPALHKGDCFCVHQRKCVVCDGGFAPCMQCGLAQGDGEEVSALCGALEATAASSVATSAAAFATTFATTTTTAATAASASIVSTSTSTTASTSNTTAPVILFLDFDRSLSSTRSGGSPAQGSHSVDAELAALAGQHTTHIVTRNRHASEIATFLRAHGVQVAGVHVVPRGTSKASAILPLLQEAAAAGAAAGARGIFVDDDVAECCDPRVAALVPHGLVRVLFRR